MIQRPYDPAGIFSVLRHHGLDFVAIGGWAAGALGVGWPTYDVDIVVETGEANSSRLVNALQDLQAEYDTFHKPPLRPDSRRVREATGPQLFRTRFGRLDVLKEAGGETYESLVIDALTVGQSGSPIRCASLRALLRMKRAANRPKDQRAIVLLEQALRKEARE